MDRTHSSRHSFQSIPPHYNLFLSNGTCVRYAQLSLNGFHTPATATGVISGIEGTNATALRMLAMSYGGKTLLVTGDMSFAYSPQIMGLSAGYRSISSWSATMAAAYSDSSAPPATSTSAKNISARRPYFPQRARACYSTYERAVRCRQPDAGRKQSIKQRRQHVYQLLRR